VSVPESRPDRHGGAAVVLLESIDDVPEETAARKVRNARAAKISLVVKRTVRTQRKHFVIAIRFRSSHSSLAGGAELRRGKWTT
jgi:hypothetical protein